MGSDADVSKKQQILYGTAGQIRPWPLYVLSDEGVHPLIAEKEFARLFRNMVIEYGLMFLTMLEKKGVRI